MALTKSLSVVLIMLTASLAGCFGDDGGDLEDYSGPIDLVVYFDTTSGMIEISQNNNGGPGQMMALIEI